MLMDNLKPDPPVFKSTDPLLYKSRKNREYYDQLEEWCVINLPFIDVFKKEDFITPVEYYKWKEEHVEFLKSYDSNKEQINRSFMNSTKRLLEHFPIFKISIVFVLLGFLCVFYDYSRSIKTQSDNSRYSISGTNFGALVLDNRTGDVYDTDGTLLTTSPKKQ
jgi:nitrate reductase gamma subunit